MGCILSVGTVPTGCILTVGTVPTDNLFQDIIGDQVEDESNIFTTSIGGCVCGLEK